MESFLTDLNAIIYVYLLKQNLHIHECLRNKFLQYNLQNMDNLQQITIEQWYKKIGIFQLLVFYYRAHDSGESVSIHIGYLKH